MSFDANMYAAHMRRISSAPDFGHLANLPDEKTFLCQLNSFCRRQGRTPIIPPLVNGSSINLYQLYKSVIKSGGYTKVTENKQWGSVAKSLKVPSPCVNVALALRRIYFQYLIAFEGEFNPDLRLETSVIQSDEGFENSGDRNMPAAIDKMLGIIAPRPVSTGLGMHRSASHLGVASLHAPAMRPRHSLDFQNGPYECPVGAGLHSNGMGIHPENMFDVRQFTVLETAEKCLLSGLSNEVDLSLNSILFLSALIHPSNATPLRLSHCNNILQLLLASVGIYEEGPASLNLLARTWTASSSLDFKQFWNNMSGEVYREFLHEDSCLLKEHSLSVIHEAAIEPLCSSPVPEDLFAPSLPSSPVSFTDGPPVKEEEEACLSRVLTVATLLVNLVTPPSAASSSTTTVPLPPQPEEDDDDLEQSVVFGFASSSHRRWMSSIHLLHQQQQQQQQQRRQPASRSLLPFQLPPLSACRDNARVLSASPTALRFAFLCAYAHHAGLRQLGLQLLGSLRYPLNPDPPLSAVSDLAYLPVAATGCCTGLELISVRFLCRCLLQSSDRCDMLAGLSLLTNLLRVPDGVNVEALFTGLPQSTWARLIQLLCLPDLALVCAALEALYCATGMGLLACTRFWRALAVSDDTVSARAPDTVFAARHASIHLRPLLALLSLEGQSMGTGSLHRVKVMQRHAPLTQPAPTFPMGTPVMPVAVPPRPSPLPPRPIYGPSVPLQPGSLPSHQHNQSQPLPGTGPYTHAIPSAFQQHASPPPVVHRSVPPPTPGPPPPPMPYAERGSPLTAQTPPRLHHQPSLSPPPPPPPRSPCSSLVSLLSTSPTGSSAAAAAVSAPPAVASPPTSLVAVPKNCASLHLPADSKLTNAVVNNGNSTLPLRVPPLVANVKPEPSSLSELTDRLQMPPPSLPPPSALRRVSKAAAAASSSSSPPQNREGTPPGRHNLRSHSANRTESSPSTNGCTAPVKSEARSPAASVKNDSPAKSPSLLSVLPAEPTTEHYSGGSRNSPPAASPATSRETSNSCGKVSPVSRGNSSTSLLEEVLNAPSTKSQLSSLLGDEPTTPIKSLASGGRLVNGEKRQLSPEEKSLASSGNGIKKELLASQPLSRLLVSKDGEAKLSTKRDQVVYPASMVNGTGYSAETDPKRPKMSPNSTVSNELEDRKGNPAISDRLSNGLDHNSPLLLSGKTEPPEAKSTLSVATSRCPISTRPSRAKLGRRWLKYNRSGTFFFIRRRLFPLRNRITVPSRQLHRCRKPEDVNGGALNSEIGSGGGAAVKPSSSSRTQDSPNTTGSATSGAIPDPLSSSSPPPNRTQAPPPFLCEWDACMMEFTTPKQVVCHVYSAHLNFEVPATATKDLERRCCLWSDCSSTMVPRAPYALIGHVIDLHCSASELQTRRSCRPLGLSTPRPRPTGFPCRPPPPYGADPTGWSIIKEVETRRLQSELWFSQMTGPQAQRLMAAAGRGGAGPFFGASSGPPPPREGPVTKHLRVTAALVLRNLATYVPEARKWLASETSLLCEIAMGACPGSSGFRTNDAGRIIAQCLAICQENASDDYFWPFRCDAHSVDLDA